jgi:hypothetical protein
VRVTDGTPEKLAKVDAGAQTENRGTPGPGRFGSNAPGGQRATLAGSHQIWPRGIFSANCSPYIILIERKSSRPSRQGASITVPTTIAILGGNTVAGRALVALLQGVGYDTRLIEDHPTSDLQQLLRGVKLLLVAPGLNPSGAAGEPSLADLRGKLDEGITVPVLTLSTAAREILDDQPGFIPWPCRLDDLAEKIEAALFLEPEIETAS